MRVRRGTRALRRRTLGCAGQAARNGLDDEFSSEQEGSRSKNCLDGERFAQRPVRNADRPDRDQIVIGTEHRDDL